MKTLLLALLAAALCMEPGAAFAEGAETAAEPPASAGEEAGSGEDEAAPENQEAEGRDEDDRVEIRGLVFEFYVADDSNDTQLAIEAADRDYRVRPGNTAKALGAQLGKTVRAQGWLVPDEAGDLWLALYAFEVTD